MREVLERLEREPHEDDCLADALAIGPAGIRDIIERGGDPEQFPQPCTCAIADLRALLAAYRLLAAEVRAARALDWENWTDHEGAEKEQFQAALQTYAGARDATDAAGALEDK